MNSLETPRPLRLGIVGCGRVHRNHAQAARLLDGVELVGVADVDQRALDAASGDWSVPGYADYRELLATGVDLVSVCLPHHLHAPVCMEVASAGAHVLCEKPLATTVEECDEIIAACDRAGVRLGVVYQHRFNENAQLLRSRLASGALGRPILGTALFQYFKSPDDKQYFAGSGWRGSVEREGGGVLNTHAVHAIDLVCWLLGPVVDVQGMIATLTHDIEVEDTGAALLRFENGALATVAASMSVGIGFESQISVSGTEGVAVLTDSRVLEIRYLNGGRQSHVFDEPLDESGFKTNLAYGRGHIAQMADFIGSIREDRPPMCDGRGARDLLALVKRIYATSDRPVAA
jgi:UDP-N-acetyl-2-amino-2-deoxyglucuronate dehydrogenase